MRGAGSPAGVTSTIIKHAVSGVYFATEEVFLHFDIVVYNHNFINFHIVKINIIIYWDQCNLVSVLERRQGAGVFFFEFVNFIPEGEYFILDRTRSPIF